MILKIATFHYSPTEKATNNLITEGVKKESIFHTGNTVINAPFMVTNRCEKDDTIRKAVEDNLQELLGLNPFDHEFTPVTVHRREDF